MHRRKEKNLNFIVSEIDLQCCNFVLIAIHTNL